MWTYTEDESYVVKWKLEYKAADLDGWGNITTDSDTLKYTVSNLVSGQNYGVRVFGVTVNDVQSLTATEIEATVSKCDD